jgi:hypothetical protein
MKPHPLSLLAGTALALLLLAPEPLAAQEEITRVSHAKAWIGIRGGRFAPADEIFREVYGAGGLAFGLTGGIDLYESGGFALAAGLDLGRFARSGAATLSSTAARLTLVPVSASILARLGQGGLGLWLEGGAKLVFYTEDSEWIMSRGSAFGFLAGGGVSLELLSGLVAQAYLRWSTAAKQMEGFTVNLGGTEIGAALLYRFGI